MGIIIDGKKYNSFLNGKKISVVSLGGLTFDGAFNPEPEYFALLQKAISLGYPTPSIYQMRKDNFKIKYLKKEGVWAELDLLYVPQKEPGLSLFATLNWKSPNSFQLYQPTPALKPDFVANFGFKHNNDGKYFRTGFIPSSNAVKGLANDVSVFFGLFDFPLTYTGPGAIYGGRVADNSSQMYIQQSASGQFNQRLYSAANPNLAITQATINSHYHITKSGSGAGSIISYINGVAQTAVTSSSGVLSTLEQGFLAMNMNGTYGTYGVGGIKYLGYGSNLRTKQNVIYNIMTENYTP